MTTHQKLLEKLCATPPPAGFKWTDLKTVLERLGYQMLANSGSRRKFVHRETKALIICHEPHPAPDVDRGCIVYVVQHLRDNGVI